MHYFLKPRNTNYKVTWLFIILYQIETQKQIPHDAKSDSERHSIQRTLQKFLGTNGETGSLFGSLEMFSKAKGQYCQEVNFIIYIRALKKLDLGKLHCEILNIVSGNNH